MGEVGGGVEMHFYCDGEDCPRLSTERRLMVYEPTIGKCRTEARRIGWRSKGSAKAGYRWYCPDCAARRTGGDDG